MKKLVIILCVLALSVSVLAVAGCGGDGDSATPEQVVEKFLKAATDGDADTAYGLITEASKADVTDKEEIVEGFSEGIESFSVGKGSISGDKASVPVVFNLGEMAMGLSLDFNVILLMEGGSWKISGPDTEMEMEKSLEKLFEDMEFPE